MSTTIKDTQESTDYLRLGIDFDGEIMITLHHEIEYDGEVTGYLTRAEFLAAVAQECGVIIIDKSELPEVRSGVVGEAICNVWTRTHATGAREDALSLLAIAEYLDAHPPIDEADVAELTGLVEMASFADGSGPDETHPAVVARYLLASGRIEVKK